MKKMLGKMPSEPYVRKAIEASVDNQSQQHFVTDYAGAHNVAKKMGHRLSKYTSNPVSADMYLSAVHLAISLAKRFLLGTYHGAVNRKYLQDYLSEFCYRFNRRNKEKLLANSLLKACVLAQPFPYAAVTL
jgi:ISXO2-like transposase domain